MKYYNRNIKWDGWMLTILAGLLCLGLTKNSVAQDQITGQITDGSSGEPLPGVNIVVKGTERGTTSGVEGTYQLSVESLQDTLVFSFIGYETTTVPINGRSTINVQLETQTISGDDIVVIGYGTQRKSDLTGSVSSIKSEQITDIPTPSLQDALQGKVAGVNVTTQSGRPGSQPIVRIRGVGTLNNADPLYVVDGMLLDDISFLNTGDVESVEVLKDASATAIYGSRGANGVIVITTKKGSSDMSEVTLRSYYGIQRVNDKIEMANAHEYATLTNESASNRGAAPIFDDPDQYGEGFDWQDWLISDAPIQNHQISASGGTDKVTYNVSGNFLQQDGVVRKSDYQRLNLRVNNEYFVSDNINFGHNIVFTREDFQRESEGGDSVTGLINFTLQADPTLQPRNENGEFTDVSVNGGRINPAAAVAFNHNDNTTYRTNGDVYVDINFLENLSFRSSFGLAWQRTKSRVFIPEYFVTPIQNTQDSQLTVTYGETTNWLNENTLKFQQDIGEHGIDLLGGVTFQEFANEGLGATRLNIPASAISPIRELLYLNTGQTDGQTNSNGSTSWGMFSYLFRANYSYKDRYLLTGTFRRDGSSRFASRNRWGNFPSAAVGWVISNESFMEEIPTISYMKLRASWGKIGNDKIDTDAAIPTVTSNLNYVLGINQAIQDGAAVTELANPNLKWEETDQLDIGIEMGLLEDRLSAEFDWYRRETKDILVRVPIPNLVGVATEPVVNAASVLNRGFEFNLNWQNSGTVFSYNIGLTGTTVSNEVLSLGEGREEILAGGVRNLGSTTRTIVGEEIGAFYGWKQEGIFQNQEEIENSPTRGSEQPGDIKIADINDDGVINDDDQTFLGSPIPDVYYGINFSASYKDFDLSLDIDGQAGNKILYARTSERGFGQFNYEKFFLDRWTDEGTSNSEPRITEAGHNFEVLDRFLYDGDFIRLRNINVGYTLPRDLLNQFSVRRLRMYVSATNVLTLTDYVGYNPQIGGGSVIANGIDNGTYPVASSYTLGVEIDF